MYQPNGEITQLLDSLAALKHEIIVFQLMAQNELDFDFKGYSELEDLETGEVIPVGRQTKIQYQETLNTHQEKIRMQLLSKHIFHRMINTSDPLDKALRDFLVQRNKGIV